MTTDVGIQRLADFRAKQDAAKAAGDTPKPFFLAVGLHKPHIPVCGALSLLFFQIP